MTAELSHITARTLVLQHRDNPTSSPGTAQRLAATIPRCEFVPLEGPVQAFLDPHALAIIGAFLTDAPVSPDAPRPRADDRHVTAIILFADIVGSTELTDRIGDLQFRERARALDVTLRGIVAAEGGEPVDGKLLGDGLLSLFSSARDALGAALQCATAGDAAGLPLHVGLHAGDVIREAGNVYGGAVNLAARISAEAGAGEVLVSDVVRGLARTSAAVSFEDRGEHQLKGVTEAQRLYRVCAPPSG